VIDMNQTKNIKSDQDNESVGERNVVGREGGLK